MQKHTPNHSAIGYAPPPKLPKHMVAQQEFEAIMNLTGVDEFKNMIKKLHNYYLSSNNSLRGISIPNFLWSICKGGGATTLAYHLSHYLEAISAMEFSGNAKYVEFELDYIRPNYLNVELSRLHCVITKCAGYNRFFRGVVCINLESWIGHANESHLSLVLDYLADNCDKWLAIFYIHSIKDEDIHAIESRIAQKMNLETLRLAFPEGTVLAKNLESNLYEKHSVTLTRGAKVLLSNTVDKLSETGNFMGYKSVEQLTDFVLYNFRMNNPDGQRITELQLSEILSNSDYIGKKMKKPAKQNLIGFARGG